MKEELKLPKIDLKELKEERKKILQERIDHHKACLEWLKKHPDKKQLAIVKECGKYL